MGRRNRNGLNGPGENRLRPQGRFTHGDSLDEIRIQSLGAKQLFTDEMVAPINRRDAEFLTL